MTQQFHMKLNKGLRKYQYKSLHVEQKEIVSYTLLQEVVAIGKFTSAVL